MIGIAIRIINAFQYRMLWGFDAKPNWRYIRSLRHTWELPAPDAGWSTYHPPFFFYLSAAFSRALGNPDRDWNVVALRLMISAIGLAMIALAVVLIRRVDPADQRRAAIAGGLLLFLPVQIYMSAMLTAEVLAGALISIVVVGVAWRFPDTRPPRQAAWRVPAAIQRCPSRHIRAVGRSSRAVPHQAPSTLSGGKVTTGVPVPAALCDCASARAR